MREGQSKLTAEDMFKFMQSKIRKLDLDTSESRASLAHLVRAVGKRPEEASADVWAITLEGMPDSWATAGEEASYIENAVHTALSLYALHKQGNSGSVNMFGKENNKVLSVGLATRKLIQQRATMEASATRRFNVLATAQDYRELTNHLRGLIQLFSRDGIKLDYSRLAQDLYFMQFPEGISRVTFKWGRDFYFTK